MMKSFITTVANEKSRRTSNVAQVTGRLFCGYHQGHADAHAGAYLNRNGKKMWMCSACMKLRGLGE